MEVTLLSHPMRVKKNIEQDHRWYDAVQKKMLYGRGGKMIFVYDKDQKRTIPRIVDQEGWVTEPSFPSIMKWIEQSRNKYNMEVEQIAQGRHVIIQVDAHQWDDMSRDLYEHRIVSDYDESELNRELE